MPDREKVIKGLECCSAMSGDECQKCPYGHECRDTDLPYGMPHLAADALALLKEQNTRRDGRWKSIPYKKARVCSVCEEDEPYKFADDNTDVYMYCPHCGAKMEGR